MKKLGQIEITKEGFKVIIDNIEKQNRKDIKYCRALGEVLHPHIEPYDNHLLVDTLLQLLKTAFNDKHKNSWIDYYCWEIDFGRGYKEGCATRKDKSNIDLSSAEGLYDFLTEPSS